MAVRRAYTTKSGTAYWSKVENFAASSTAEDLKGKVQLIVTSPPFPLNKKKAYGNLQGDGYKTWLAETITSLKPLLSPKGSLVVELGNAWVSRSPEMSTLPLETLLEIKSQAKLHLCQQFIAHNPARLPSPVQWVNIKRTRVKDSFTNVWWFSKSAHPKADNRNVLTEYSDSMKALLKRKKYNSGRRPSGHKIGESSFLKNHGGAIPPNVIQASNTAICDNYREKCHELGIKMHPARMQTEIPEFFIRFLTDPDDLILDPFAGSNTTGAVAQREHRRWLAIESDVDYLRGSTGRFDDAVWRLRTHPLEQVRE